MGVSQRMFGALLTWMQEHTEPVFLVATANDIEALPAELLRKGRFDEIFFVDLPGDDTRKQIFKIHLRKRKRDPEKVDLGVLVELSDGFSGAEIEQAVVSAMHEAFASKSELKTDLIARALRESPPLSVTMAEKVAELRAWGEASVRASGLNVVTTSMFQTLLEHCPFCGYALEGLPEKHVCPECGQPFDRRWASVWG